MKEEEKNHINVDLDFLDKKEELKTKPVVYSGGGKNDKPDSSGGNHKWRNLLIIGGAIVLFGWLVLSGSSDSNPNVTQSNSDTVRVGDYSCSTYDANQVDSLDPVENISNINSQRTSLDSRLSALNNSRDELDNSSVGQYSEQYEIDNYNEQVDEYNRKLASYKSDLADFNSRVDRFNQQVDNRNNYLTSHCTKAY